MPVADRLGEPAPAAQRRQGKRRPINDHVTRYKKCGRGRTPAVEVGRDQLGADVGDHVQQDPRVVRVVERRQQQIHVRRLEISVRAVSAVSAVSA
jgi:hypothetical protein